jgi:hypothetical protein
MRRPRSQAPADQAGAAEPQLAAPFVIDPNGIYLPETVRKALKLRASSIRREVREGRLRIAKRCGRHFILGAWLLAWVADGELSGARN